MVSFNFCLFISFPGFENFNIKNYWRPSKSFQSREKTFLFKLKITYYLTDDIFLKDFPNFHQTTRNLFYDDIFIKTNSAMRETDITLDTKNILRQFLTAILPLSIHVCIKHQWGENTHTHTHTHTHPHTHTHSHLLSNPHTNTPGAIHALPPTAAVCICTIQHSL